MTSWLGDQAEKVIVSIPDHGKDTVKIWRWLLIPLLRYLEHKIHTERKKRRDLYRRRYALFVDGDVIPLAEI